MKKLKRFSLNFQLGQKVPDDETVATRNESQRPRALTKDGHLYWTRRLYSLRARHPTTAAKVAPTPKYVARRQRFDSRHRRHRTNNYFSLKIIKNSITYQGGFYNRNIFLFVILFFIFYNQCHQLYPPHNKPTHRLTLSSPHQFHLHTPPPPQYSETISTREFFFFFDSLRSDCTSRF